MKLNTNYIFLIFVSGNGYSKTIIDRHGKSVIGNNVFLHLKMSKQSTVPRAGYLANPKRK